MSSVKMIPQKKQEESYLSRHQVNEMLQKCCKREGRLSSPIDIATEATQFLYLEPIEWVNLQSFPSKMALHNSGDTVTVKGLWECEKPRLAGGHLEEDYTFSRIHFRLRRGTDDQMHTLRGESYPLEMHVVFYKSCYKNEASAAKEDDGTVIVVYFFEEDSRSSLSWLTQELAKVAVPRTIAGLPPLPLSALVVPFSRDYFMYWGALPCAPYQPVQWVIARSTLRITRNEMKQFDKVQTVPKESTGINKFNRCHMMRTMFHVNPSPAQHNILHGPFDPPSLISVFPKRIEITVVCPKATTINIGNRRITSKDNAKDSINTETQIKCISRNSCAEEMVAANYLPTLETKAVCTANTFNEDCEKIRTIQNGEQSSENKMNDEKTIIPPTKNKIKNEYTPTDNLKPLSVLPTRDYKKKNSDEKLFTHQKPFEPTRNTKPSFNFDLKNKVKQEKSRLTVVRRSLDSERRTRSVVEKVLDKEKTQKESIKSLLEKVRKETLESKRTGFMVIETAEIQKWLEKVNKNIKEEAEETSRPEQIKNKSVCSDNAQKSTDSSGRPSEKNVKAVNVDPDTQNTSIDSIFQNNSKGISTSRPIERQLLLNNQRNPVIQMNKENAIAESALMHKETTKSPTYIKKKNVKIGQQMISERSEESVIQKDSKEVHTPRKTNRSIDLNIQRKSETMDDKGAKNKTISDEASDVSPTDSVKTVIPKENVKCGEENNNDNISNEKNVEKEKDQEKRKLSKIPVAGIVRKRPNPYDGVQSSLVHLFKTPAPTSKTKSCSGGSSVRPRAGPNRNRSQVSIAHMPKSPCSSPEKNTRNSNQLIRQNTIMSNRSSAITRKSQQSNNSAGHDREDAIPFIRNTSAMSSKSSAKTETLRKSGENMCADTNRLRIQQRKVSKMSSVIAKTPQENEENGKTDVSPRG